MKRTSVPILILALVCMTVSAADQFGPSPPHPESFMVSPEEAGDIYPGFNNLYLQEPWNLDRAALRDTMDWRSYAPAARNQGVCNTCWIFAALGEMELQLSILSLGSFNFSEDHLKECNPFNTRCAGGGNFWMSGNYLTQEGARLETCQPYHAYNYTCLTACEPVMRLREYRTVANTVDAIKAALNYGPVITSINAEAWGTAFQNYDGSYVLSGGSGPTNHSVVIVGYDDPQFPEGHWIVRNSYGTSWGDDGYFYIQYGAGAIGSNSCQHVAFEEPLESQDRSLLYFDTHGVVGAYGNGSNNTTWGAVRFVPSYSGDVERVEFAALGSNFTYTIRIYNSKSGSSPSIYFYDLMHSVTASAVPQGGYLSVDIDPPLAVQNGNDFYVVVQFDTPGGDGYPVPVDNATPTEGQSFLSLTGSGSTWQTVPVDICIRAVMFNPLASIPTLSGLGLLLLTLTGSLWLKLAARNHRRVD